MAQRTKIDFHHRRIGQISDFAELVEILFPGNRNQQHAAACIFFELKWANDLVPNMAPLERKHNISRRILQRTRAKLARLGVIEHVSYLNSRYGGRHGWKLSSRFEAALRQLAEKCAMFRHTRIGSRNKEGFLLQFTGGAWTGEPRSIPGAIAPVVPVRRDPNRSQLLLDFVAHGVKRCL